MHVVEAVQQENKALGQTPPHHSPAGEDCQVETADVTEDHTSVDLAVERCTQTDSDGGMPHKQCSELSQSRPTASPRGPQLPTISSLSSTEEPGHQRSGCRPESWGGGEESGSVFRGSDAYQMTGGSVSDSFTEQTLRVITERVRRLDARCGLMLYRFLYYHW